MMQTKIARILNEHTAIICNRVRAKWGNIAGIKGNSKINSDLPKIVGGIITATIEGSGSKAWQCEFGRGSLMAKTTAENPYLPQFFENTANGWNPLRKGYSIRGRAKGSYTDLDGKAHESTGKMAGLNLEKFIGARDAEFRPLLPQRIIEREITRELPEIWLKVQGIVETTMLAELTMNVQVHI